MKSIEELKEYYGNKSTSDLVSSYGAKCYMIGALRNRRKTERNYSRLERDIVRTTEIAEMLESLINERLSVEGV